MADVDNKQVKSKREMMLERLKNRYPDKDFSDDEAIFGQISDDVDEVDKELSGYKEREKAFSDLFTGDPRSAQFISDWRNGEDPVVALIRRHGIEIKDAIDDPEKQEVIAQANKEYVERLTKSKELEELYTKNLEESLASLEKMQQERGLSDEQMNAAMEMLLTISNNAIIGVFTPESIDMALKAINHDADVETANHEGLVQGKNTKVEEKLRKMKGGDGVLSPAGKGNSPVQRGKYSIFDEARGAD